MWSIKNNISWKSMSNYQNSCSLLQSVKLQYFNGLLHLSILSKCQQSNHFSLLCNGLSRFGNGGFDCNRQPTTRAHTHTHTHTHTHAHVWQHLQGILPVLVVSLGHVANAICISADWNTFTVLNLQSFWLTGHSHKVLSELMKPKLFLDFMNNGSSGASVLMQLY